MNTHVLPKIWPANLMFAGPPIPVPFVPILVEMAGKLNPMVRAGWWANYCYTTRDSLAGFHKVGYRIATKKNGRSLRLLLYLT